MEILLPAAYTRTNQKIQVVGGDIFFFKFSWAIAVEFICLAEKHFHFLKGTSSRETLRGDEWKILCFEKFSFILFYL